MSIDQPDLNRVCTCPKCKIFMPYIGVRYARDSVCTVKYDDGEPYTTDERMSVPYATWKCEQCGHVGTDGY